MEGNTCFVFSADVCFTFTGLQAMCVQLLTAVGALSGCILSLLTADAQHLADAASSSWVRLFCIREKCFCNIYCV